MRGTDESETAGAATKQAPTTAQPNDAVGSEQQTAAAAPPPPQPPSAAGIAATADPSSSLPPIVSPPVGLPLCEGKYR